jgi:hypothetical protein
MRPILSSFTTLDKRNHLLYSEPIVINKGRRLMDLTRKLALQDKMFYLCIAVAVAYSAFAIWTMYASIKLAGGL